MSGSLYLEYTAALGRAMTAVTNHNRDGAMAELAKAMQCANRSKDARYRRAVFRAMSFTRRIPTANA